MSTSEACNETRHLQNHHHSDTRRVQTENICLLWNINLNVFCNKKSMFSSSCCIFIRAQTWIQAFPVNDNDLNRQKIRDRLYRLHLVEVCLALSWLIFTLTLSRNTWLAGAWTIFCFLGLSVNAGWRGFTRWMSEIVEQSLVWLCSKYTQLDLIWM